MASEPTDPNGIEALRRQIAELQAQLAAVQQASVTVEGDNAGTIATGIQATTQGGAVVAGSVEACGHFIGRDFLQTVTNVIHPGEDAEEAKSVIAA